jgi:uncharacterized protein YggE
MTGQGASLLCRTVRVAMVTAAIVLAGAPAVTSQEQSPPPGRMMMRPAEPSITVVGSGTASARPDIAEVAAGVVTQSATAAQALAQNNAAMGKVLKAVTALGIEDKDIQTTNVSVVPQRRQGRQEAQPPEILGYEVSNQLRIKVRDLAVLGRLLDTLVGEGANVLGGISFSVGDPAPVLDQARAKAMADARRRAEAYTQAAGVKLGRVLSIREGAPAVPRFGGEMPRALAASAVPVAPGEQEFQASVTVTYALE